MSPDFDTNSTQRHLAQVENHVGSMNHLYMPQMHSMQPPQNDTIIGFN